MWDWLPPAGVAVWTVALSAWLLLHAPAAGPSAPHRRSTRR
ncbi:MAG: hypothetical protein WCD35_07250 [Mycobacteriales bacterium]